jgi:cellulose synthase (UDP-forming)
MQQDLSERTARCEYRAAAHIAGPPRRPSGWTDIEFRSVLSPATRLVLSGFVLANGVITLALMGWLLLPTHVPEPGYVGLVNWQVTAARLCFCLMIGVEAIKVCQNLAVWLLAYHVKNPVPVMAPTELKVAMLTTIVPSREPVHLVERTLRAMKKMDYPGPVDVWILDEEDSPGVREMAARLDVRHFTRKGRPQYNQPSGAFRARTKSGNHNAWRAEHESDYDVVCQMDPDHVPFPCLLERTLGYFRDPNTAFVVGPQVYGNIYDTFVSRGASVQQYVFSGVIERAGNGLDAPLLIGTNHLYRPAAWQQIGGYQDSVTEDHLTGMRVLGTVNPATNHRWRGVYTPDVLAIGEGPRTWTDYFNQQKRWAYGIWEIKSKPRLREGIRLSARQRLLFGMVQFYYPSVAAHVLLGGLSTMGYLLLDVSPARVSGSMWLGLWASSTVSWFTLWLWLRRFNLAAHERRDAGLHGIALTLLAGPIYVAAGVAALLRRPLRYVVTPKGGMRSQDSVATFRLHVTWAIVAAAVLAASMLLDSDHPVLRVWALLALLTGLTPPLAVAASRAARGSAARRRTGET